IKGLNSLYIRGGQSAVNDAVYLAVMHASERKLVAERRHALVLITDGEDRQSYYSDNQLFELLQEKDVQVFIIGIVKQLDNTPRQIGLDPQTKATRLLKQIARVSGGRVFFPRNKDELNQAAEDIVHDLHFQYIVGYESQAPL